MSGEKSLGAPYAHSYFSGREGISTTSNCNGKDSN